MKYIIDVEKIEGTNLWKAKEFNSLVFDENGLDRLKPLDLSVKDIVFVGNEALREENKKIKKMIGEKYIGNDRDY